MKALMGERVVAWSCTIFYFVRKLNIVVVFISSKCWNSYHLLIYYGYSFLFIDLYREKTVADSDGYLILSTFIVFS